MKINKGLGLILLLTSLLNAKDLVPKELIGIYSKDVEECNKKFSDLFLGVSKDTFSWYEDICTIKNITLLKNGFYNLKADCNVEGEEYEDEFDAKKVKNGIQVGETLYYKCN